MSDTTIVRLTPELWAALQALTAGGNATTEAVQLEQMFAGEFTPAPKVIGEAVDLIAPWAKLRALVGRNGPVTVTITGQQGSGKTLIADALAQSLRTVNINPRMIKQDGDRRRYKLSDERGETGSEVVIEDVQ